ncbi:hypothetical protein HPP92_019293 [Vanilla planifolia]|uniref:Uncharacterized protein n=1 Tax=Vanilla planifolia TaxID=51239 RepID=A0A835QAF3_VANPL|nr:hypothetical protein HPP92_019293 [Vanilla planifolia]
MSPHSTSPKSMNDRKYRSFTLSTASCMILTAFANPPASAASSLTVAVGWAHSTRLPKNFAGTTGLILARPLTATRTFVAWLSGSPLAFEIPAKVSEQDLERAAPTPRDEGLQPGDEVRGRTPSDSRPCGCRVGGFM